MYWFPICAVTIEPNQKSCCGVPIDLAPGDYCTVQLDGQGFLLPADNKYECHDWAYRGESRPVADELPA
jgi:hypothetical protein